MINFPNVNIGRLFANREHRHIAIALLLIVIVAVFLLTTREQATPLNRSSLTPTVPATAVRTATLSAPTAQPAQTTAPAGEQRTLGETNDGSWTPAGPRFAIGAQSYEYNGERQGNRCRVTLAQAAQPWVPCSLIGEPEPTAAPAPPASAPQYVWSEEPEPAAVPPTPQPFPTFDVSTADLSNPYDATQVSCLASGEGCPTPSEGSTSGGKYWGEPEE